MAVTKERSWWMYEVAWTEFGDSLCIQVEGEVELVHLQFLACILMSFSVWEHLGEVGWKVGEGNDEFTFRLKWDLRGLWESQVELFSQVQRERAGKPHTLLEHFEILCQKVYLACPSGPFPSRIVFTGVQACSGQSCIQQIIGHTGL